jgi:hypothetical protein
MTMMGHNSRSLASAAEANIETGVWLLCKEALVTAISDSRLDRLHLKVLACMIEFINARSAKAWPDRTMIAQRLNVEPVTVSNKLRELRLLGYLIAERERVEDAGNRSLMVYTVGNIDHDTIRREITAFVKRIRESDNAPESPRAVTPGEMKVTAGGDRKSLNTVTVTECGDSKSPRAVTSNSSEVSNIYNNKPTTVERPAKPEKSPRTVTRGTRLPDDWFLPKTWGDWTVQNFEVNAVKVRVEAERFKNYWLAKSKDATKLDWFRTWQNWCSEDRKGWKRRVDPGQHAPDLIDAVERKQTVDDLYAWRPT